MTDEELYKKFTSSSKEWFIIADFLNPKRYRECILFLKKQIGYELPGKWSSPKLEIKLCIAYLPQVFFIVVLLFSIGLFCHEC